jgi:flavin reductase (DIM6/NTAB) family NADH-FMN oxidoreductase RutF
MAFAEVKLTDLNLNPFGAIGQDWMLVTAGDAEKVNTMTASWGGLGVLWGQNVAFVFIRPQRYTKEFMDKQGCFSLSFFDGYKQEMGVLGSVSGRDRDKIAEVGMHVTMLDGVPAFAEAKLVLVLDTLYADEIKPEKFLQPELVEQWYPKQDWHTAYVAKIRKAYVNE